MKKVLANSEPPIVSEIGKALYELLEVFREIDSEINKKEIPSQLQSVIPPRS